MEGARVEDLLSVVTSLMTRPAAEAVLNVDDPYRESVKAKESASGRLACTPALDADTEALHCDRQVHRGDKHGACPMPPGLEEQDDGALEETAADDLNRRLLNEGVVPRLDLGHEHGHEDGRGHGQGHDLCLCRRLGPVLALVLDLDLDHCHDLDHGLDHGL